MLNAKPRLSILIPVYNEEKTISKVVQRVLAVRKIPPNKELIIVDDGSFDKTSSMLKKMASSKIIKIYRHSSNKGKGAAVRTCISKATGDILIIQDGDLELDPRDYPNILEPIIKGDEKIVYGSRFKEKNIKKVPLVTYYGNKFLTCLTNLLFGSKLTDMATAYKAFKKETVKNIKLETNGFEIDAELTVKLLKKGYRISEVPIRYYPRTKKEGKKLKITHGISIVLTLLKLWLFSR